MMEREASGGDKRHQGLLAFRRKHNDSDDIREVYKIYKRKN